jgi:hypothetical protein
MPGKFKESAQSWVEKQLKESNGCGIEANALTLKKFYSSEEFWPKDYTVYDLFVAIEGDEDLTDEFECVGEYIKSLEDETPVEIVSGIFNYEFDETTKPQLCIREQFLRFCSDTMC